MAALRGREGEEDVGGGRLSGNVEGTDGWLCLGEAEEEVWVTEEEVEVKADVEVERVMRFEEETEGEAWKPYWKRPFLKLGLGESDAECREDGCFLFIG